MAMITTRPVVIILKINDYEGQDIESLFEKTEILGFRPLLWYVKFHRVGQTEVLKLMCEAAPGLNRSHIHYFKICIVIKYAKITESNVDVYTIYLCIILVEDSNNLLRYDIFAFVYKFP